LITLVSQILLSDDPSLDLPPYLRHTVESARKAFPTCTHKIYTYQTLRDFISEHYDGEIVETFDTLRPFAYKADLGRYCLLNAIGGWYFDISLQLLMGATFSDEVEFLAFRDIQKHSRTTWSCMTAAIYSRPNNRVLQTAIDLIVRNRKENYYGVTPLCPTGPTLLGEALAVNRANPRHVFGDFLELTPTHDHKNSAFVLPDGRILAWGKRAPGGDLSTLGVRGGNNYNELWKAHQIYSMRPDTAD
jgi:mannosyltransferase OCH1-like enzyme